jgi:hypothetical protein
MEQLIYDFTKSSIMKVSYNKELFIKEIMKLSETLLPHERDGLINWLFYYTAEKLETLKWFYELIDKNVLVS